jgi:hypothetical protein
MNEVELEEKLLAFKEELDELLAKYEFTGLYQQIIENNVAGIVDKETQNQAYRKKASASRFKKAIAAYKKAEDLA